MNEKLLITVMKENPLENGEAIYTIDDVKLVSYYTDNKSTVIDSDGVVYRHICDKSNTGKKVAQKEYYNLTPLSKLVEKYPNAISVTRDKRDKEYLEDMSNYGVTLVVKTIKKTILQIKVYNMVDKICNTI